MPRALRGAPGCFHMLLATICLPGHATTTHLTLAAVISSSLALYSPNTALLELMDSWNISNFPLYRPTCFRSSASEA